MRTRRGHKRAIALVVLAATTLAWSHAHTASSTVAATKAGYGQGTINGYTTSSIRYNLNSSNPDRIDSVTMTVDTAPKAGSTLKAQLVSPSGTWYSCTSSATSVTCDTTAGVQATVMNSNNLRVIIAD